MIDLTSKSTDEINELIRKYSNILVLYNHMENHIPYLAYIFDICNNHLLDKHHDLPNDWKIFSFLLIEKLYFNDNDSLTDEIIVKTIDDFVIHIKNEFENYNEEYFCSDEYEYKKAFTDDYLETII